jgi:PAS domain S-box-containing protein
MLGYELDELEKHFTTWVNRVHPEDFPGVQQTLYNHLNGETDLYKVEYRMRTKSGDWKWVEDVGKVVERDENGKATRVIGLYYDISDLKNIQNQLQELNATKDKFFSIIAHDLKNPFSAILGFSRLIQDECSSDRFENIQEYNGYVLQSATTGYDLLVNLLDWARIQNGKFKFNPESLDLSALLSVQEVSFHASLTKKHQKIRFDVPDGFVVRADRFMFDTVLRYLISNAIKYTPEGGEIAVRAERKDGVSEVRITDTGVGIPSDKMDKLFKIEEGYSTAGTNNETGTGLGLILCRDFMKQQHGTIGVESVENHGTTFILTFPQ